MASSTALSLTAAISLRLCTCIGTQTTGNTDDKLAEPAHGTLRRIPRRGSCLPCVPGMIQSERGESRRARYKRSRRLGEGQGGTFCILPWEIRRAPRDLACSTSATSPAEVASGKFYLTPMLMIGMALLI